MNEEEAYKQLKEATPEQLLEAAIWFWTGSDDDVKHTEYMLRFGFAIAQKDGWKNIAPAWLRAVK